LQSVVIAREMTHVRQFIKHYAGTNRIGLGEFVGNRIGVIALSGWFEASTVAAALNVARSSAPI
jgi:hypothetical protein